MYRFELYFCIRLSALLECIHTITDQVTTRVHVTDCNWPQPCKKGCNHLQSVRCVGPDNLHTSLSVRASHAFFELGSASVFWSNSLQPTGTSVNAFVTDYNLSGHVTSKKFYLPSHIIWGPCNHLCNQKSGLPEKPCNRWEPTATKKSWLQWVRERCNCSVTWWLHPSVNVALATNWFAVCQSNVTSRP